ncbi:MAG: DUF3857 domain-containing protein [Bryobacteraceae bacterium]
MKAALCLLLTPLLLAAKDLPQWVREADGQNGKAQYPPKVAVLVLLKEERLAVDPDGKRVMTERRAVRILQAGRRSPVALREYNTKAGHIRDFRAWLLLPNGKEIEYPKSRVLDIALTSDKTPYEEERAKMIECDPEAPVGSVFAYEVTEEESTIFTTHPYLFQESEPVLLSRFVLSVPAGWEARGTVFNHPAFPARVDGTTYTWELRDLPWIADEEHAPGRLSIVPRLGITYFPASSARPELAPFKDWTAVSAWHARFSDAAAETTESIRARSGELLMGATTELDKIRAVGEFVQQTNYVSVDLNVMHGGGYIPRPASQVLARNYGDCKDKATLMRALLKAAGIGSYETVLYAGDRAFVRPEWPSPMQFNHAIVAVQVSPGLNSALVLDHPRLGRLLFFDPTDPSTPVGDLPREEQGSLALVIAASDGDLVRVPRLPPGANRIDRTVALEWNANGSVSAHMVTRYYGQAGSAVRFNARHAALDEFKRSLESSLSRRLGAVTISTISHSDHPREGWIEVAIDFEVQQFGQSMQGRMLVLRPGSLVPDPDYRFPNHERRLPIRLSARIRRDRVSVSLPRGFQVDEIPTPVHAEGQYGEYRASWQAKDGRIAFEQSLEITDQTAAVTEYARVKDFFDVVAGGQAAPLILLKQ